jgi:hypothetical protein
MERIKLRKNISLSEFANIYVPFGILIFIAIMAAELTQNLNYYRTIYSIWVTTALLIPAICLYILPGESEKKTDYGLLLWTFSFFAYLVHFYYGVFITFHASLKELYAEQGVAIATANLILTLWWGIDVFLGWFSDSSTKWIQIQSLGAHIYIVLTFFIATVILFEGFIRVLGIIMTAAILICLTIRLIGELKKK